MFNLTICDFSYCLMFVCVDFISQSIPSGKTGAFRGWGGAEGIYYQKRVGVCCHEPGSPTPFQTRLDKSKTDIYHIVDIQYMLICSVS